MKRYLLILLILLIGSAAVFVSSCSPRQEPFHIGSGPYLGYQPFFLSDELFLCKNCPPPGKFIGGSPYQISLLPSTLSAIRLFQAGELDGVILTLDAAVAFQQQTTVDVCIAEVMSHSKNADALIVGANFDPTQPIVVGYEQTPFGAYLLSQAVEALGWRPELIEVRYVTPKAQVAALMNQEINALITYEPYITELLALNNQVAFSSKQMPVKILDVLIVTRAAYEKQTPLVKWITTDFWEAGVQALKAGEPETMALLQERSGISSQDLEQALAKISFFDRSNRAEISAAELSELVAYFTERNGITVNGRALQRCDATLGGAQ